MDNISEKKFKTVVISGQNAGAIKESSEEMLKPHFPEEEISIILSDLEKPDQARSFFENSFFPVLVLNQVDGITFQKAEGIVSAMSGQGFVLINSDWETIRQFKEASPVPVLSFGFEAGCDFFASDLKINGGINFKMNHSGKSVPIWLEKARWEGKIDGVLAVVAIATVFGLNLVEISQALKGPDKA